MPAGELPTVRVGDHVTDREDDDATLLVTGLSPQDASSYTVNDESTVADYNPEYPSDDDVVEAAYPQRSTIDTGRLDTYAFPRSRLQLETPLHDRDPSEVTMLSGDSEIVECIACGQTGIKARIQPTACPHETFDDNDGDGEGVVSVARGPGDRGTGGED